MLPRIIEGFEQKLHLLNVTRFHIYRRIGVEYGTFFHLSSDAQLCCFGLYGKWLYGKWYLSEFIVDLIIIDYIIDYNSHYLTNI